jgi:hypothetical protein
MVRRSAAVIAVAGVGVAGVLAGAALAAGGSASAATPCGSTTASPAPTVSGSATATPTSTATATATTTATASGSASPSASSSSGFPTGLPVLPIGGQGQGTTTATPTGSATSSPTPSGLTLAITPPTITKGKAATASGRATAGCTVDLWAYTRPGTTYKRVRSVTASSAGTYSFTIYPAGNTRAFVRSPGTKDSLTDSVDVREVVSIKASKLDTRRYRFAGGIGPAGLQTITVYRVSGSSVVTVGSVASDSTGAWQLDHTFGGTGTFTFYAVGTKTQDNAAGTSPKISVTLS